MGATEWMYFTPYQADPEKALQRLRQEVFAEGRYRPKSKVELLLRWIFRGVGIPKTIEEAVEFAAEDGTHSILDIYRTGNRPEFGISTPLPEIKIRDAYVTTEPSRQVIEQHSDTILAGIARWEAVHFVVFEGGKPNEWVFLGCSGD